MREWGGANFKPFQGHQHHARLLVKSKVGIGGVNLARVKMHVAYMRLAYCTRYKQSIATLGPQVEKSACITLTPILPAFCMSILLRKNALPQAAPALLHGNRIDLQAIRYKTSALLPVVRNQGPQTGTAGCQVHDCGQ